jgi:branched-chain amino acid transport system permease protein
MLFVIVTGLATGALFAATALVYNVMFSTSKVLSVTTGHIPMLGGVFGAYAISGLGLPWWLGLVAAIVVGAAFGWLTDVVATSTCGCCRRSRSRRWSSRRSGCGGAPSPSRSRG